jgi:hypothetical protein
VGASANLTPEKSAPQISHPNPRHKPHGNIANADNGVRADQKSNGKEHAVKQTSLVRLRPEEIAQFDEFLRWRALQLLTGGMKPAASSQQ